MQSKEGVSMVRRALRGRAFAIAVASLSAAIAPARAAVLDGITMPDSAVVEGVTLQLNGIALRTATWMGVHVYVAAFYLRKPNSDAGQIMNSSEEKLLLIRFVHDVDAETSRRAWQKGFELNCRPPCHLPADQVQRFLSEVPPTRAGDLGSLAFTRHGLRIQINGTALGTITDPVFARTILAGFIGPNVPSQTLKHGLLGLPAS